MTAKSCPKMFHSKDDSNNSDFLNQVEVLPSLEENKEKIKLCFKFLHELKHASKITASKTALNICMYLYNLVNSSQYKQCLYQTEYLICKYKIIDLIINIFLFCYDYTKQYLSENEFNHEPSKSSDPSYKHLKVKYYFVAYLTDIVCFYTENVASFQKNFHSNNGIRSLFNYISDTEFVNDCLRFKYSQEQPRNIGAPLLEGLVHCLFSLSKVADSDKKIWHDLNVAVKLFDFAEQIKEYPGTKILVYLTIVNVINEEEMEMLPKIDCIIDKMIELINTIAVCISSKENLKRKKILVRNKESECAVIAYKKFEFNLVELLESLNRIATHDKMKWTIFKKMNFSDSLKNIITHGNQVEKQYAFELIWQLCFDHKVYESILEDKEIVEHLGFIGDRKNRDKFFRKNSFGVFWLSKLIAKNHTKKLSEEEETFEKVNIDSKSTMARNAVESQEKKPKEKHIMISYNREDREICLRIKKELEDKGHIVWIDVEDIHGSSLESMANAVENSKCVLICMSEKYKQSPNCRAEAEYSFNLRKPIVPLIMQKNYTPDGWLGIILGTKIFVNFTKYDFAECIKRLNFEIEKLSSEQTDSSKATEIKKPNISTWTSNNVQAWLNEKKFHSCIDKELRRFDGELLIQLRASLKASPDLLYKLVYTDNQNSIDLYSYMRFLNELENLN